LNLKTIFDLEHRIEMGNENRKYKKGMERGANGLISPLSGPLKPHATWPARLQLTSAR
jgi:hypothetical protein